MNIVRPLFALAILCCMCAATAHANWMTFTGGPAVALGTWPGGSGLSGFATVTATNFVNGNLATPAIGLTPLTVGPPLSADFFAAGLLPNPGNTVPVITTPYNDAGDMYHVEIDFSGTVGSSSVGILPAGTLFALIDLDIEEDYRRITATNAANVQITTPWIAGPNGYFDATPPIIPQSSLIPNPTLVGPAGGVYDMFGVAYNFDVGMWLFTTTQDIRTLSFDMDKSTLGNAIGGGGAGWAFYAPIPEPSAASLAGCFGVVIFTGGLCRIGRRRRVTRENTNQIHLPCGTPLFKEKDSMHTIRTRLAIALAVVAASFLIASTATADPIPGRDLLKFSQLPMDGTPITSPNGTVQRFWGHDELSTAYSTVGATGPTPYRGTFMADDFADKFSTPVVHVKWWGSYLNNFVSPAFPLDKFLISFEEDVPAGPNNPFSHPGIPLLNQIVRRGPLAPGSGTFTEMPVSGGGPPLGETLYEYNAELHLGKEFFQKPDTVYWLKIVGLVDLPPGIIIDPNQPPTFVPRWGWHNRDYTLMDPLASTAPAVVPGEHIDGFLGPVPGGTPVWHFQDDAVTGHVVVDHLSTPNGQIMPLIDQAGYQPTRYLSLADGPPGIGEFSKDLAFELYSIPEPGTWALLSSGIAGIGALQWRRRTSRRAEA
jgi:PEP-CTERM motif